MEDSIRDKWAAALESGRYEQAKGTLRRDDSYCCLGVLCEVFREETGEGEWVKAPDESGTFVFSARDTRGAYALPIAVREWAGLPDSNPRIKPGDSEGYATYLNDHRLTFEGIAALIRQLPGKVTD